jgi:choice-of-anchor B domain-containing protein
MSNRTKVVTLVMILCGATFGFGQGSPNVVLLAHMDKYPTAGYSSNWGYTAPDGREYALEGVQTGTSIVDITDPANIREVTFIPGSTSDWREIKTYQHYAYVVNETGGGMQIIDMSNLPVSATLVATYTALATAHTLWIDETSGILYAEGNSTQPVKVISLANPTSPVQIGFFGIECHDIVVQNNIAYISEGTRGSYGLYDVSTPSAAVRLGTVNAPAPAGYAHNCWPSPNGQYLMTTEENTGETVKMFDISNLSSPALTDQYLGSSNLAHNVYIRENFSYIAHYADGLKIVDIANPFNIFEVGFYDTNPATGGFNGAWNIYPFFPSGKIALSDIQNGVWVFFFDDGSQKPTITSTPATTAVVGQPYSYDSDNLVNVLGTPTITFSFTGPPGFNVNATTGAVSWTPTSGQIGAHPVSITATNAFGSHTQNFTITVSATGGYAARINCGGPNFTDGSGNLFVADKAFTAGSFGYIGGSVRAFTNPIANTTDDPLYQDIRYVANGSFNYRFDVPAAGNYNVTLYLMSPFATGSNVVMDVIAEGAVVFNDLNVNAEAGGAFTALTKSFTASVTDGQLHLRFTRVTRAALVCGIAVQATTAPSLVINAASGEAVLASMVESFQLFQNHPNPFNPTTRIRYRIPAGMSVSLKVYNMLGEEVRTLVDKYHHAGSYEVEWDGRMSSGARAASGVYVYRLAGEKVSEVRKMVLLQ